MKIAEHLVSPEEVMAWVDGELTPREADIVSIHIAECSECSTLADQFRDTARLLATWTVEAAPESLDNAVSMQPTSDVAARSKVSRKGLKPGQTWSRKRWALGSLAAILLLAFGISSFRTRYQASQQMSHWKKFSEPQVDANSRYEARATEFPLPSPTAPVQRQRALGGGGGGGIVGGSGDAIPAPMIARTVALTILVEDVNGSRASLDAILSRYNGYAAQLSASTPENAARTFQASLRVPASLLAATMKELKTLGRVQNETQAGEEVSQQHADLVARLQNARESEQRLRAILQQRTGKIEDVLQVEEEIARVRGEIETMEADQKALEHRVDYATVDLQLTEVFKAQLNPPDDTVANRLRNAVVRGYRNASGFLLHLLLFFAEYGPTLLVGIAVFGLPAFLILRRYRRILARM